MERFGVNVQRGRMAGTPKEAGDVARWIRSQNPAAELILKAQIHAGGRGKGTFDNGFKGGVKFCANPEEVEAFVKHHQRRLGDQRHRKRRQFRSMPP